MKHAVICLLGFVLLAACRQIAPPTLPAQLAHTPGPPIRITGHTYETITFHTIYPTDWTAISSPAYALPWVVFVSPDERAVIMIATDKKDAHPTPPGVKSNETTTRREQVVLLGDKSKLTVVLIAAEEEMLSYEALFERIFESIAPPQA